MAEINERELSLVKLIGRLVKEELIKVENNFKGQIDGLNDKIRAQSAEISQLQSDNAELLMLIEKHKE